FLGQTGQQPVWAGKPDSAIAWGEGALDLIEMRMRIHFRINPDNGKLRHQLPSESRCFSTSAVVCQGPSDVLRSSAVARTSLLTGPGTYNSTFPDVSITCLATVTACLSQY